MNDQYKKKPGENCYFNLFYLSVVKTFKSIFFKYLKSMYNKKTMLRL